MKLLLIFGAMIMSFTLVMLSIPAILRVARAKCLFEPFEERKVHVQLVPSFGGVAIFIGFLLTVTIFSYQMDFHAPRYIIAAITLMFFTGLKDDLVAISPLKKFMIQVWAALILIVLGNLRFTNLHGILGIYEINYITSLLISLFTIITVTNAFNLIDGVDGLASGLAIMAATVFGAWFYLAGYHTFAIVCAALAGGLIAFFLFNVFGNFNKLFLGDSGSLILGIILSTLIIKFNESNIVQNSTYFVKSAPTVSFAIVIVAMVDMLRVMSIRILQKKSPFYPDKNHIHHYLLRLYRNHLKVTITLLLTNILLIGISILFSYSTLNVTVQFLLLILIAMSLSLIPWFILLNRFPKARNRKLRKKLDVQPTLVYPYPMNNFNGLRMHKVNNGREEMSDRRKKRSNGEEKIRLTQNQYS